MNWLRRLLNLPPRVWVIGGECCTPSAHTLTERELRHARQRQTRTPLEIYAQ